MWETDGFQIQADQLIAMGSEIEKLEDSEKVQRDLKGLSARLNHHRLRRRDSRFVIVEVFPEWRNGVS